jgi:hypothetical protein
MKMLQDARMIALGKPPQTSQDPSCTAANAQSLTRKALAPRSWPNFLRQQYGVFQQNQRLVDILCKRGVKARQW